MSQETMTYKDSGVDYDAMDPFKRACQLRAAQTSKNAERLKTTSVEWSRGESAHLLDVNTYRFGSVNEGLGTKNLVADAMSVNCKRSFYDNIAQDTVAMIVNDLITLGTVPLSLAMHLDVGHSDWFEDKQRVNDLVEGWGRACDLAGCIWSGGETATLKGILYPQAASLSGSAIGYRGYGVINPSSIREGDAIIFLESSGIHANGLTLAREIADKITFGYRTKLSDGRMYGEVLLDPTHIHCDFVEECLCRGIEIHYCVNITGHGWRKLMRAKQPFTYVIEQLPKRLPIFEFIQRHGPVSDIDAYGTFNMGAGFAIFVPESSVAKITTMYLDKHPSTRRFNWLLAGHIEKSEKKRVIIKPGNITFIGESLDIREV